MARSIRCSAGSPDSPVYTGSPVNYSGAISRGWRVPEALFLGAPDTVRCTPDSPVNYSGAISRGWRVPEPLFPGAPDTVRCTPDSPVNYSGAPLDFPEGEEFSVKSPGAPDTVRWCTGHCLVAHRTVRCAKPGCLWVSLCSFVEPNTWSFYWLRVNLLHLYNLYTRAN